MGSVYDRVKVIVVKELKVDESEVSPAADFVQLKTETWDMELLLIALEEEFSIEISYEESGRLYVSSIGDVVACIERLLAEQEAA